MLNVAPPVLQAVLFSVGSAVNGAAASDDADEEGETQAGMPADEANEEADEDMDADEANEEQPVAAKGVALAVTEPIAPLELVASDVGDFGELMREKNFVMAFGLDLVAALAAAAKA